MSSCSNAQSWQTSELSDGKHLMTGERKLFLAKRRTSQRNTATGKQPLIEARREPRLQNKNTIIT